MVLRADLGRCVWNWPKQGTIHRAFLGSPTPALFTYPGPFQYLEDLPHRRMYLFLELQEFFG